MALTLWGAHVLVARRAVMHRWKYALSPVVPVTVVLFTLLVLEPDLGMTVTLGIVLVALLFYAGAPLRLMAALCGGAAAGALLLAMTASYRMSRIVAFLSPGADTDAAGFQSRQALYSLAGGGLFGQGLGQGSAKWDYLPNAHNDFIFAIIGEELGFVGAFAVLGLFGTLAYAGLRIATRVSDPWLKLVVATSATWLVGQAAINIAYVVGLLPVTGLTLPLISVGRHVAGGHHVRVRDARQRGAPRARGDRRAAPPRAGQAGPPAAAAAARALPAGLPTRRRPRRAVTLARRRGRGQRGPHRARAGARRRRAAARPVRHASPRWAPNAGWTPRSSRRGATPSS